MTMPSPRVHHFACLPVVVFAVLLLFPASTTAQTFTRTYQLGGLNVACCNYGSGQLYGFTPLINDTTLTGDVIITSISVSANGNILHTDPNGVAGTSWQIFVGPSSFGFPAPGQLTGPTTDYYQIYTNNAPVQLFFAGADVFSAVPANAVFTGNYNFTSNILTTNASLQSLQSASSPPFTMTNGLFLQVLMWSGALGSDVAFSNITLTVSGIESSTSCPVSSYLTTPFTVYFNESGQDTVTDGGNTILSDVQSAQGEASMSFYKYVINDSQTGATGPEWYGYFTSGTANSTYFYDAQHSLGGTATTTSGQASLVGASGQFILILDSASCNMWAHLVFNATAPNVVMVYGDTDNGVFDEAPSAAACGERLLPFSLSSTQMSGSLSCSGTDIDPLLNHGELISSRRNMTWGTTPINCAAVVNDISLQHWPAHPLSSDGKPTSMFARFKPSLNPPGPLSGPFFSAPAIACGYTTFDWQQKVDLYPAAADLHDAKGNLLPGNPPSGYDPPQAGLEYLTPSDAQYGAYPFVYRPETLQPLSGFWACEGVPSLNVYCPSTTGPETSSNPVITPNIPVVDDSYQTLFFLDMPWTPSTDAAGQPIPPYKEFRTRLVGVLPTNLCNPTGNTPEACANTLAEWAWTSTYEAPKKYFGLGGVTASTKVVPGDGTGGVTLTSVNGQPISQFSTFSNKLEMKSTGFELVSNFTLDSSKGESVNPLFADTVLNVGGYSVAIPANLFHQNRKGQYVYEGKIDGEELEVQIVPNTPYSFTLKAEGSGASMNPQSPALVELMIGHHMGVQAVSLDD